jgi:hypothetical protein
MHRSSSRHVPPLRDQVLRACSGIQLVPTLFRLLFMIGLVVALAYGAMIAIVTFVQPVQREITQSVPLPKGVR